MPPPAHAPGTCGACIAFAPETSDGDVQQGRCRLRAEMGQIASTLPRCPKYVERGTGATWTPKRAVHGRGSNRLDDDGVDAMHQRREEQRQPRARNATSTHGSGNDGYAVERRRPPAAASKPKAYGATIALGEGDDDMDTKALRALIQDVLFEEGVIGETHAGARWEGGTLILKPGVAGQQSKEVPLEAFFKKIVMIRDRLRVLEQKINASEGLTDREKVDMQQYVTRCYGSLTTFNILFADAEDHFKGSGG